MISFGTQALSCAIRRNYYHFNPDPYSFHTFRAAGAEGFLRCMMNTSSRVSATEADSAGPGIDGNWFANEKNFAQRRGGSARIGGDP